ncbi:hypothetical protein [Streptomyces sp. LKA04]|uniref:hypothetical protein n=1 Tax=Streptomyces sp. LKA04 TaxID=3398092 RepID=UPI003A807EDE
MQRKQQAQAAAMADAIGRAVAALREMQALEPDHVKAASLYEVEMGLRHAAGTQNEVTA